MSRPARILVVDDDSLIRRGTVRLMRASGYEALEAASGAEGVELARAHAPDLVLLDVDMPGLGGIEVCRALKADPVLNGTFVVLCSGTRTTSEQQTLGLRSGADGYIARPIANDELVARVEAMLRIHAGQVALRARTAELEALLGSFQSVTSGLDLREILIQILEAAVRISGAAHVKVLLLDKVSNTLQVGALKGTAMPPLYSFPVGMSLSGLVAQRGESLFISNTQTDPRNVFAERDRELGIVTYLGLPIKRGDEVLGVLSFNTDGPHEYTAEEISLLTSLAAQAAIAIEHARLYAELTQHAATLEGRVRERTRDLEAARQAAEAASRAKSEFLANMSHELRTPLNATLGFSHLLLEQRAGPLSAKQIRYCENIVTAGNRLLDTIGDILTYVEMETGRLLLEPQAFAVEAAVDEVLAHVQVEAAAKQLRLERSVSRDLPALTADPARFQRILRALLGNAVKFTPPGGTITVHACTVLGQSGDPAIGQSGSAPNCPFAELSNCPPAKWLEISVTDTGIGFTPADIPRLFQQFMQLESAYTKRHAGIGIGLALAKRLVELQGGTITAVSPGEGLGSTFTIRLPLEGTEVRET